MSVRLNKCIPAAAENVAKEGEAAHAFPGDKWCARKFTMAYISAQIHSCLTLVDRWIDAFCSTRTFQVQRESNSDCWKENVRAPMYPLPERLHAPTVQQVDAIRLAHTLSLAQQSMAVSTTSSNQNL